MDWESFAEVDELLNSTPKPKTNIPIQQEADKTIKNEIIDSPRPKFDILQHLMNNKEQRKQQLISQHHVIGEKLSRKHTYESPLQHKSKSNVPNFEQHKDPSPLKSVGTVSTLKRFDSKFDDWNIKDYGKDQPDLRQQTEIPAVHELENEHFVNVDEFKDIKISGLDMVNTSVQLSQNHLTDKQIGNSSDVVNSNLFIVAPESKLVTIGIQTSFMGLGRSTQTQNLQSFKEIGIQTDVDYFDPLLSFSKQSIEKELQKDILPMQKELHADIHTPTKRKEAPMTLTPIKKVPGYKQVLIQRFLEDVQKLMSHKM